MDPIDLSPLSFIIDNTCLTGFAEYHGCSSVPCKSQLYRHHPKVHLFFSGLSILPINVEANIRYLEQYNKHQLIIKTAFFLFYRSLKSITIFHPFTLDPVRSEQFLI
ncbi:unnamed protein product [Rotaria sp. Silwood2]|nr:unnamed protein product [Rotaria sp. Silwood2]